MIQALSNVYTDKVDESNITKIYNNTNSSLTAGKGIDIVSNLTSIDNTTTNVTNANNNNNASNNNAANNNSTPSPITNADIIIRSSDLGVGKYAQVLKELKLNPAVDIRPIKTSISKHLVEKSENLVWMKTEAEGKTVETAQLPSFNHTPHITTADGFDKRIEVTLGWDKQTVIKKNNEIVSSTTKFATQTELTKKAIELSKQPGYEYLGKLINQGNVNLTAMDLYTQHWDFKQQGLTPAAAALIAMAVTMATGGSGASVGATRSVGFTSPAVLAAANAAFASFLSQTTVVLINNQGDISKTLRDIATTDTLRSMATAALTAGFNAKIAEKLNLSTDPTTFTDHLTNGVVNGMTEAFVDVAVNGGDLKEALKNNLRNAFVDAGTASVFKNFVKDFDVENGDAIDHFASDLAIK